MEWRPSRRRLRRVTSTCRTARRGSGEFLTELLSFPNGRHGDQVDSVSQFLRWLQNDAYQNPHCAQVGAEGWCRSNKRMGLPDTTSRTVYKIREAEAPILSATITVMK